MIKTIVLKICRRCSAGETVGWTTTGCPRAAAMPLLSSLKKSGSVLMLRVAPGLMRKVCKVSLPAQKGA